MPKNLVIVESPAKAKTIQKYLGKDFEVQSSFGHVVDLPKKNMGIDIENHFKPKYVISPDKREVVKKLKELSNKAETVWLASDEDREGEAIAWHLYNELDLKKKDTKRIVFNEITKKAILNAVENPRTIDEDLVNAQQARRILDRLVGFEMSPVLWKKVKPGLSAGRVQSVAVRLIVEREKEIMAFEPENSFRFVAEFVLETGEVFEANLNTEFENYEAAKDFIEKCAKADFSVSDVETKPGKRSPAPPFTTSTLQQEASRKLGFSVSRTMSVAQQLYEQGMITYMRTDSVNLSDDALAAARQVVNDEYGAKYAKTRKFKSKTKGAQEAHEAIRPTNLARHHAGMDSAQNRLYDLIYKRTLASQMADAELERTTISVENNQSSKHIFRGKGEVVLFDGFLKVYQESREDDDEVVQPQGMTLLPKVSVGEQLNVNLIKGIEKFTRHAPRYSEATLVRQLEELGIGRPSTYAPTISTIQKRDYVELNNSEGEERAIRTLVLKKGEVKEVPETERFGTEKNKLKPTDVGIVVNDFLVEYFKNIMDYQFTAKVEEDFDEIAAGKEDWTKVLGDFYKGFHENVEEVEENATRATGERLLGTDPKSGKNVYARIGRYGAMVQIGEAEDEEKPKFAGLNPDQNISTITLDEALKLFDLPKELGKYKGEIVEVNVGRYGPYVKFGKKYISLDKNEDPHEVEFDRAKEIIDAKLAEEAPIAVYEGHEVTRGKGRFGPFIKWNEWFINVNKKYDFDNLSQSDIKELIEDKKKKEAEKVVKNWETEGIRIEKARWKRHNIIQGKLKVEVGKEVNVANMSLEDAQKILENAKPKKATKKTAAKKATTKKITAKKSTKKTKKTK
ncbi:type I DNA topoisomerase [Ornithobacterium rhinotracheale]|uniref:type I DNA topoisomerase n=1 Tax=Ornithobacterium rhinotracheale TaxID=28251 RepID=UPI00129C5E23|nr:type I DNA topoisomerase [Ornithobacterium rhinotracheale]MRJ07803.1 type I DNA topoisomerase [Ornithobacterium rhinotracheale]UOH78680.1 type I DNA topoisomerase [Ornithobacterium rhinotracheale]